MSLIASHAVLGVKTLAARTTLQPLWTAWRPINHCGASLRHNSCFNEGRRCSEAVHSAQRGVRCSAAGDTQGEVYEGVYGPWVIEPEDVAEVWSYRVGLTATVAAFVGAAIICSATDSTNSAGSAAWLLNPLALLGAAGLGVSLVQIHIYVTPLKRALQVLWALGVAGGVYLLASHPEQPLPLLVVQQPWSVWLVGPAAAAVTGVAIKEGLCYGKAEAASLALLLPLLCLTHLSGAAPAQLEQVLLLGVCGVGCVFAARKYSQAIKDDIGDKSVFMHMKQLQQQEQS